MTSKRVYLDIVQTIDFNTEVGKVGVIGFHTPGMSILNEVAGGLLLNYSKVRFESMDFALACVSQLPVDPLGVGYEPGKVAPQDVVNPILFKACTGESLNALLNSIYDQTGSNYVAGVRHDISDSDNAYYRMMNDPSFRKAHPQSGMTVTGLVPMVREILFNRPIYNRLNGYPTLDIDSNAIVGFDGKIGTPSTDVTSNGEIQDGLGWFGLQAVSGRLVPLPSQETYTFPSVDSTDTTRRVGAINDSLMRVYVGALVTPPAIQQSLYFRLQVVWHVSLSGFRPLFDIMVNPNSVTQTYYDGYDRPVDGQTAAVMDVMQNGDIDVVGIESVDTKDISVL